MGRKITYMAWVAGRNGKLHKLSPNQIIADLKKDIELGREWSIDPKELINVISKPEFSELKANEIKTIILNYSSDLLEIGKVLGEEAIDIHLITYCYYTAYGDDAVVAKSRYKECILGSTIEKCLEKSSLDTEGARTKKWLKNWESAAIKNFYRFFGPELSRWEFKIRKKFKCDCQKFFQSNDAENSETGN